ncbi:MAG: hypothetical protein MZV70_75525 [Desulfobacterales bacterium]|nr:hypothetical protein [Desulfobacterales bacterium]
MREAEKAEGIVGDEVLKFAEWYNTLEVVPTIVSLREKVESIMRAEMEKSGSWLKSLGEEDRKNIEILTAADHQQDPPRPRHGSQGGEPVERGHALRGGHPEAFGLAARRMRALRRTR